MWCLWIEWNARCFDRTLQSMAFFHGILVFPRFLEFTLALYFLKISSCLLLFPCYTCSIHLVYLGRTLFFSNKLLLTKKKKIIIMPIEVWFLCFFLHEFTKLLLHIHTFFFLLLEVYWLMIICGSCVLYTYIGSLVSLIIWNKMQARVEKLLWKSKMKFNLVQSHWKQKQPKLKGVPCRKPRELQKLLEKVQELILCNVLFHGWLSSIILTIYLFCQHFSPT